ncbi:MAG: oligosaccharide flippase family protein [Hyphomonadaceae bacterium]|nr:oligosaccharide flippase family protein [Hyphomonadaceae bacterium]
MARRIGQRLASALRSDDARHAGLLIGATTLGQVVLLGTMPILARLFPPAEWGALVTLTALATVGASVSALCYDSAIVLPRSERAARALFALSARLIVVTSACGGLAAFAALLAMPAAFGGGHAAVFALGFFVYTLAGGAISALGHALGRGKRYRPIALSKITQTAGPSLAQVAAGVAGYLGSHGLVAGRGLGLIGAAGLMAAAAPPGYRLAGAIRARRVDVAAAARMYRDVILQVPRQLLVRGATALPALFMVASYGAAAGALFFFAQRLVERPGALLGDTLSRLPMRRFAQLRAERKPLLRAALAWTAMIAAPIIAGVALTAALADQIVALLFGPAWMEAGGYVVVMSLWAGARLSAMPLTTLIFVLRRHKAGLTLDGVFSLRALAIPTTAFVGGDALTALSIFTGLSVLYHALHVANGVRAARRHDRALHSKAEPHE